MIKPHCFEPPWIFGFKGQKEYKRINPGILEKMIHALALLQHLKKQGLDFVFKGGTSLIIILKKANRFSVDIDIITLHKRGEIEKILDAVVQTSHFEKWELDEKRSYKEGVPKAHYFLTYPSNLNEAANYILLDILFEEPHYPKMHDRPIIAKWIETEEEILILTPTAESILGDKLTAFAPNTTGIPYFKNDDSMSMEIIKQLFDVGNLFDQLEDVEMAHKSFKIFSKQEIGYRKLDIDDSAILNDIIQTSKIIAFNDYNSTEPEKNQYAELKKGIRSFSSFLISGEFRVDDAIIASSKAAYLAAKFLVGDLSPVEKYTGQDIVNLTIKNKKWNRLNILKKHPDKSAYFYWYQTLSLLNLIEEPQQA